MKDVFPTTAKKQENNSKELENLSVLLFIDYFIDPHDRHLKKIICRIITSDFIVRSVCSLHLAMYPNSGVFTSTRTSSISCVDCIDHII